MTFIMMIIQVIVIVLYLNCQNLLHMSFKILITTTFIPSHNLNPVNNLMFFIFVVFLTMLLVTQVHGVE
jgi:hypothetical protein